MSTTAGGSPLWRTRNNDTYTNTVDYAPADYLAKYSDSYYNRFPAWGGDGLAIDITGESVYYAGGGAAARLGGHNAQGGLGGGGAPQTDGTDGLGGGGGAGAQGGSGVVIVRYVPYASEAFSARGGTSTLDGEYRVHTFTSSGTFSMPCDGLVDLLIVGGGGGGGTIKTMRAAGGGAGGLVYLTGIVLSAGDHAVTIGAGGAVGANGGDSSIANSLAGFGTTITAYGGGHGAAGDSDSAGASGGSGGGASSYSHGGTWYAGGAAVSGQGHDGSAAGYAWGCGGGGGAGSSPTKRTCNGFDYPYTTDVEGAPAEYTAKFNDSYFNRYPSWGGDGLAIDITGESVYYAGGGAAARLDGNSNNAQGGLGGGGGYNNKVGSAGTDGLGGGGAAGFAGGSGVVVVRYKYKPSGTVITIR